jgi:hypothetical protein
MVQDRSSVVNDSWGDWQHRLRFSTTDQSRLDCTRALRHPAALPPAARPTTTPRVRGEDSSGSPTPRHRARGASTPTDCLPSREPGLSELDIVDGKTAQSNTGPERSGGNAAKKMDCDLHPRLGYLGATFAAAENIHVESLAAGDAQGRVRPRPDGVVTGAAQRGKRRPAGSCAAEAFGGTRPLFGPRHPRAPHLR